MGDAALAVGEEEAGGGGRVLVRGGRGPGPVGRVAGGGVPRLRPAETGERRARRRHLAVEAARQLLDLGGLELLERVLAVGLGVADGDDHEGAERDHHRAGDETKQTIARVDHAGSYVTRWAAVGSATATPTDRGRRG